MMQKIYNDEVNEIVELVEKKMINENITIKRTIAHKVNGDEEQLTVQFHDSNIGPSLPLKYYHDKLYDGYTLEEIAEMMVKVIHNSQKFAPEVPELSQRTAKENLYCVVVNTEMNQELLKTVPHEKVEDLSVVPRFRVGDMGSVLVTHDLCRRFQMTPEEVLEYAWKNTNKEEIYINHVMNEVVKIMEDMGAPQEYIEEFQETQMKAFPLYIVSNRQKIDGAVAMASKTLMDQAFSYVQQKHPDIESIFVIGSSRHEVLLIPDMNNWSVEDLLNIHKEVQGAELSEVDKLTENIYRYNGRTHKLSIADSCTLSKSQSETKDIVKTHSRSF